MNDAQALQNFLQVVSHDLREPLRHVISFAEILQQEEASRLTDDGRLHLNAVIQAGSRLQRMLAALLELARVETGGQPIEPCDLNSLLASQANDLHGRASDRLFKISITGELPSVLGDAAQLRRLFHEVLTNALQACGSSNDPHIVITGRADPDTGMAQIDIQDHGPGFGAEFAQTVFEPFQRLETPGGHDGIGMGLTLCRRICERHNGQISARPEPGKGTLICVELPLAGESTSAS